MSRGGRKAGPKRTRDRVMAILFVAMVLNFLLFAISTWMLGGEALSGKIEDGRYYVKYRTKHTEVSRGAWWYSRVQTISMICTHVGGIATGALIGWLDKRARRP